MNVQREHSGFITNLKIAWAIASRDFKARYSGSFGDISWVVVGPALYAVVFLVLRRKLSEMGLDIDTAGIHPVLYAFTGVILWQIWFDTLLRQVQFFNSGKNFLKSRPMPPEIFFYAQFMTSISELGIRLILIFLVTVALQQPLGDLFWLAPVFGLLLVFTANVIGLILAIPGSFLSDVVRTLQSISLGLFLVSPIFYAVPNDVNNPIYQLNRFNPFGVTLTNFHSTLYGSEPSMFVPFLVWVSILLILLPALIAYFRSVGPMIVERL